MSGSVVAVVLAAGRGTRSGGFVPKQYRRIAGISVIRRSLRLFLEHPGIAAVQPVIHPEDRALYDASVADLSARHPVNGGLSRQASVLAGLEALEQDAPEFVLVHDAARPFASSALVRRAIEAATSGAAIPVLAVTDTMKTVDATGRVTSTLDRNPMRIVQTPQSFAFRPLLEAHRQAARAGRDDFTDDAALAEWAGMAVTTFAGEAENVKLTTQDDFRRAEEAAAPGDIRNAMGFDVHAFGDGDHVMLGGIRIGHDRALHGHSDADVVLHALVDAILGALSEGDIGTHFPPSDPKWKGAASSLFLQFAVDRVKTRGGQIAHLDVTLVCERPKIGPHRDAMRARIAEIAGIDPGRVGIKATTSEGLGFTGRGEGIACFANATIRLPWS